MYFVLIQFTNGKKLWEEAEDLTEAEGIALSHEFSVGATCRIVRDI